MKCPACGLANEGRIFCSACGTSIGSNTSLIGKPAEQGRWERYALELEQRDRQKRWESIGWLLEIAAGLPGLFISGTLAAYVFRGKLTKVLDIGPDPQGGSVGTAIVIFTFGVIFAVLASVVDMIVDLATEGSNIHRYNEIRGKILIVVALLAWSVVFYYLWLLNR